MNAHPYMLRTSAVSSNDVRPFRAVLSVVDFRGIAFRHTVPNASPEIRNLGGGVEQNPLKRTRG